MAKLGKIKQWGGYGFFLWAYVVESTHVHRALRARETRVCRVTLGSTSRNSRRRWLFGGLGRGPKAKILGLQYKQKWAFYVCLRCLRAYFLNIGNVEKSAKFTDKKKRLSFHGVLGDITHSKVQLRKKYR